MPSTAARPRATHHAGAASRTNVARDPTGFFGRDAELSRIEAWLASGERLVTLLGPGGIGKSRLAREFASRWVATASERTAWFCDLAEARDLDAMCARVAEILHVPLQSTHSTEARVSQLEHALESRRELLVVLDNFEQLIEHAGVIARWHDAAPEIVLIVTSREMLRIRRERVLDVTGLSDPDRADGPAVQMLVERAARARVSFVPGPGDREALRAIAVRLEGLPLALELAAARLRAMDPAALLARLGHTLSALDAGPRDLAARQSTLRRAIDWSWQLLGPHEQCALAQCSVFRGSFTLEAAERVLDIGAGVSVDDVLQSLRDRSLLRVEAGSDGSLRFVFHVSIHEFAAEQLHDATETFRERHARFYAAAAEARASQLETGETEAAFRWFLAERENLMAAMDRGLAGRPHEREGVERALRVLNALEPALWLQGRSDAQRSRLEVAIAAAAETGAEPLLALRARIALANAMRTVGDFDDAAALLEQVTIDARARGDLLLLGRALRSHVQVAMMGCSFPETEQRVNEALAVTRRAGDRLNEALTLASLATALREQMRHEEAFECYQHAIALQASVGNEPFRAVAMRDLGLLHLDRGELADARRWLEASLAIQRRQRDPWLDMFDIASLGLVEQAAGNLDVARSRFEEAIASARTKGISRFEAVFGWFLAQVQRELRRYPDAVATLEQACELLEKANDRRTAAAAQMSLAAALASLGRIDDARTRASAARSAVDSDDVYRTLADVESLHIDLAVAARARAEGDFVASRKMLERVRAVLDAISAPDPAFRNVALRDRSNDVRIAARLAEQALGDLRAAAVGCAPAHWSNALVVQRDCLWFALPDGTRVELGRRRALRNVLLRLVDERVRAPGAGIPSRTLINAGWPDEKILARAARNRLNVTITTLRNLGLRNVLIGDEEGYRLDPDVPVRVVTH
jgi:predicted ATPase/Tfp pilus assembly protein PilF